MKPIPFFQRLYVKMRKGQEHHDAYTTAKSYHH